MKPLFNSLSRKGSSAFFFLCSLFLWSCSDSAPDPALSLQGSWLLSHVDPAAYNDYAAPDPAMCADLVFTQEEEPAESSRLWGYKMTGNLPTNAYQGNYQVTQEALLRQTGKLGFVNLGITEVNAPPAVKKFESYFLQTLQDVDSFEVKNDVLTLWASEKNQKLVFVRGASSCGR
ncbi:META domain-containing protein [Rufibacter sediminis]|uniref:META domain-containing protein n=1 Tax=Rufibacter sediminis TaxID=2762756 RepID=A0ABR6VRR4_9BACT|nr:META domain-containing protein [Rufibacter sediminis]MBC3539897.1 META domain-containing protein [Rufibacter sediminis]